MRILTFVAVLLVGFAHCHQIEFLAEEHNLTQSVDISEPVGAIPVTCIAVGTFCVNNNCKTGPVSARSILNTCTAAAVAAKDPPTPSPVACLDTEYCHEPTPGTAMCGIARPITGCPALPRQCSLAAQVGTQYCSNSNPCLAGINSIITCLVPGGANNVPAAVTNTLNCNAAAGFVGCLETVGGDAKCIRQFPFYCPNSQPFVCTGYGFYPNAFNCGQYFQCLAPNGNGIAKICPNGQVFDPMANSNGNQCKVATGSNCIEAQCANGAQNILLTYPGFSKSYGSYAVTCGGQQPLVYRCEDGFVPNVQVTPITCTGYCPGLNRRAVNPSNRNGYYSCAFNGGRYVGAPINCPPSVVNPLNLQVYNPQLRVCTG